MSIIYSWLNPNKSELSKIEVYRSDKRNGPKTLIATLPGTATFYEDTTAAINRVFFYNTIAYQGTLSSISPTIPLASFENTGPGNSRLLRGDWEFGYFGQVPKAQLPTFASLGNAIGSVTDSLATANHTLFHKWVVNGNIVFIPNCPLNATGTTYQYLIDKKVAPAQNGDETNLLRLSLNGFNYRIRPPYLSNELLSKPNDGSIVITGGVVGGTDPSLAINEFVALIKSFISSDSANRFNSANHMADSPLIPSDFQKYFFTATWMSATTLFAPGYASTLNTSTTYGPNNGGILFWPMFVLDQ